MCECVNRCVYLYRVEDGLQHGQDIAEEEIPSVSQRVQQLLTCLTQLQIFNKTLLCMHCLEMKRL